MDMSFSERVKAFGAQKFFSYLQKDPEKNIPTAIDWLAKHGAEEAMPGQMKFVERVLSDPNNKWYQYVLRLFKELDPRCIDGFARGFVINGALLGIPRQKEMVKKYGCNIPWTILFDPTSACNKKCIGCWAAEYGHQVFLTNEDMDKIVTQGKELGIYVYLMTGGEPLMRKKDLLWLAEKHKDCYFHIFTNGSMIDEEFCKKVAELGNMSFALSLEGTEDTNDARRGEGSYVEITRAMKLMKQYGIVYAISVCYTHANYKMVTSDEYINLLIENGARIVWYFHYMPVGNNASADLLLTPEEREYVYRRVRYIRSEESPFQIFSIDFQNDGEFMGGCIAGGKNYCHINSNGDVEPCVFIHYSQANIKNEDLLDCLRQPLFLKYRENQPFNHNHLQPCPMLENPEAIVRVVHESGAHSTDLESFETPEHLTSKTVEYAKNWAPKAAELWKETHPDAE